MKLTREYKRKYETYWRTLPEVWWLPRLLQEVGELADTFTGETEDTRAHELRQIASICLNWLDMRGEYEAEETEAEKLVEWLKHQCKLAEDSTANKMWLLGRTDMIAYTLMEITTHFGEEEGDADREGD